MHHKTKSFFKNILHRCRKPGMPGNLIFLLAAVGLLSLAVHSGYVTEHTTSVPEKQPVESVSRFSDDDLHFYQDTITQLLLQHRFNGNVLLARDGEVIFSRSFGFADFRNHAPLQPDTPFQLASISKTFTAAAVLILHHEGLIDIDDHVDKHIPEFPWDNITVRHLLNHTSGVQNYMWLVERYWKEERKPNNEDMLQLFIDHPRHLDFWPGTRFAYSNTGYGFLGLLIERVSRQSYASFLHERIFEPLNMENSFVYDPNCSEMVTADRAFGFRPWRHTHLLIPDVRHDGVLGDKGIYASTYDLYNWDQAITNGKILPEELWEKAFGYTTLRNGRQVRYGMGWRLQNFMDSHVVHHPGRWNGFRTSMKRFVDKDATLILLNNTNRNITHLVQSLQHILFLEEIRGEDEKPPKEDPREYRVVGG